MRPSRELPALPALAAACALVLLAAAAGACERGEGSENLPMLAGGSAEAEAGQRAMRQAMGAEATSNLARLSTAAVAYFQQEQVSPDGAVLQPQFPGSVGRTPGAVPCGQAVESLSAVWGAPTWQALQFTTPAPHYFSYQFDSYGQGGDAQFVVWAFSDLDCNGVVESQHRVGRVQSGQVVVGPTEAEGYDQAP